MARTQTTYAENISNGRAGQVADTSTCDVATYVTETSAGVGFGLAVQQGAKSDTMKLGVAAGKFVGVTVKDPTRDGDDDDKYARGSHAGVLYRGTVWVTAEAAVVFGQNVTAKTTTGALSSKVAGTTQLTIAGARWMTSASTGKLAQVRLSGAPATA